MSVRSVVSLPGDFGRISSRVPEVRAIHKGMDWTGTACVLHAGWEPHLMNPESRAAVLMVTGHQQPDARAGAPRPGIGPGALP